MYHMYNANEADEAVKNIIQQIRTGQTKEALEAIEKLDKTTLEQLVRLDHDDFMCDSILKVAIGEDAREIINKLIEKNCSLGNKGMKMGSALTLWFSSHTEEPRSSVALDILEILFKASQQQLFNNDNELLKLVDTIKYGIDLKTLSIIANWLGKEKFIPYLFRRHPTYDYIPINVAAQGGEFYGCLEMLLSYEVKLTTKQMFILRLISRKLSQTAEYSARMKGEQNPYIKEEGEIEKLLKTLSEKMIPEETKSLSESEFKPLLTPQTTPPMQDFPVTEYWRLFVDGKKQAYEEEGGWAGYEKREPGSIQNMYNAFMYVRENLETESLTYEITDEIHRQATLHLGDIREKGFRASHTQSGMGVFDALSYDGFLETIQPPYSEWYKITQRGDSLYGVCANFSYSRYNTEEKIIGETRKIIQNYHENFSACGGDRTKQLQCIIRLASDYARFHPYKDGNNRTAVCILNRELEKHGFPLTILSNPNELEGHSQAELFIKICEGMKNFLRIKAGEPYPGGEATAELSRKNGGEPPIKLAEPVVKMRLKN